MRHEPDLSQLLDGSHDSATPGIDRIVARARTARARRLRRASTLGVVVAVSAAGVGVGVGLSGNGGGPATPDGPVIAMRERIPEGLSVVGHQLGSATSPSAIGGSGSPGPPGSSPSSNAVCTIEGCIGNGLGTISIVTPIPAPVVGNLVLRAEAYSERRLFVGQRLGWKPFIGTVHGVGVCSTGPFLYVSMRAKGSARVLGQIVVPSAATTGRVFDVIGTTVLGNKSSGRLQIVVTRTASRVERVSATWQDGATRSAVPVDGWTVLAVSYLPGAPPLVRVTATGPGGARLDQAVVPATGSFVTAVRTCQLRSITAPMNR